jgi:hypothetical protein
VTGSANVQLVRSIWAAWERGDYRSADWAHPDIELVWADGPRPGTSRGLAGMAAEMRDLLDVWDGFVVTWRSVATSTPSVSSC